MRVEGHIVGALSSYKGMQRRGQGWAIKPPRSNFGDDIIHLLRDVHVLFKIRACHSHSKQSESDGWDRVLISSSKKSESWIYRPFKPLNR